MSIPGSALAAAAFTVAAAGARPAPAVYVAPTGSDAGLCTRVAPCATLDRGYHAARPGGRVVVAAGRYPAQTITHDPAKRGSAPVVIEAAPGARVTIAGRLQIGSGEGARDAPSHLILRDLTAPKQRIQVTDPAQDVTLDHDSAGSFYVDGAQHITVRGGDYGNCGSEDRGCEGGGPGSQNWIKDDVASSRTRYVTITGVRIHDYSIDDAGDHYECLFLLGGTNITIEDSHFWNCEIYDVFIQANGPHPIGGVTIQNNWFGRTQQQDGSLRGSAVVLGQHDTSSALSNVLVRYNSFAAGEGLVDEGYAVGDYTNVRAVANIFGVDGNGTTNPTGGGGFTNC